MVDEVYLHVGPHKTGTTFLQRVLRKNQDRLAADGGVLPGGGYRPQRDAALELMEVAAAGGTSPLWDELAGEARAARCRFAVVSVEQLDAADTATVRAAAASFGRARVHVVYTARDLTHVVPAWWHTRIRKGALESWDEYVAAVRATAHDEDLPWELAPQDPVRTLAPWSDALGPGRVHLVTVPRPGAPPELLWQRFAGVLGVAADAYALDDDYANPSMGAAEVEVLRRLNVATLDRISRPTYERWVRRVVVRGSLALRPDPRRYALAPDDHAHVRERGLRAVAELRRRAGDALDPLDRVDVVGDLAELEPAPEPAYPPPDVAPSAELLDAAFDALRDLVLEIDRVRFPTR